MEKATVRAIPLESTLIVTSADVEVGRPITCETAKDPNLVSWNGDDDPEDPRNWSAGAKWTVTLLMSAYSLVTLLSSSMLAPALPAISAEFHIESNVDTQIIFAAFILSAAIGPVLFAPLSEIYGRKVITQCGNAFYLIWTIVGGFAPNKNVLIAGRFFSGLGASVVFGVEQGLLADCWRAEERGKSLAILSFAPLLGPALGPIFGGVIVQATTWRWIFWSIAIFDGALQIVATFYLRETYSPVLLARKAYLLRKSTGNSSLHTPYETADRSLAQVLRRSCRRPFLILCTHPVAQILTLFGCVGFGSLYIVLSTYATIWIEQYQQPASAAGLHYLALVLGFTLGSQGGSLAIDRAWRRVAKRKGTEPAPELRIIFMVPGVILWGLGLLLLGWAVEARVNWLAADAGAVLFGAGVQIGTTSVAAYFTDTYGRFTASAQAGSFAIRSLCAFAFPLFAPSLYEALGYGVGNSVLVGVFTVVGLVTPAVVWKKGAQWRARCKMEALE